MPPDTVIVALPPAEGVPCSVALVPPLYDAMESAAPALTLIVPDICRLDILTAPDPEMMHVTPPGGPSAAAHDTEHNDIAVSDDVAVCGG